MVKGKYGSVKKMGAVFTEKLQYIQIIGNKWENIHSGEGSLRCWRFMRRVLVGAFRQLVAIPHPSRLTASHLPLGGRVFTAGTMLFALGGRIATVASLLRNDGEVSTTAARTIPSGCREVAITDAPAHALAGGPAAPLVGNG